MIETFVRRPVTTIILILFFVVLGVVSYFNVGIEETPKIDFPIINIEVVYPGATPLEVETQVIKKIEDAISEISEVKKVNSYAYENFGLIVIEFLLEADVNIKSIEVKDKVDAIIEDLPDSAEKPIIEKFDPLAKPVMNLVLFSDKHDLRDVYEYADKKLKGKLTAVSGVASVDFYGGKERQINVRLDPILMKKYFISIDEVIKTIKMKNLNIPGGAVDTKDFSFNVRYLGEYITLKDIKETPVVTQEGTMIPLSKIATVEDSYKKIDTMARYNGKDVVSMNIINVSDANAIKISTDIRKVLPDLIKALPDGMKLEIANDQTTFIQDETIDTELNILIGIILTIIILFIFTGSVKVTLISAVVIPTSIISTFFLMDSSKFSINMMTLLAIATSLGTLIANAIVIIENVLVHLDKGKDPKVAAVDGTKEVAVAVLASVGTNLVVFTPIAFMGGIVGRFMMQFGFTVIYATLFSLIASFTLTPMLCGLLLKSGGTKKKTKIEKLIDYVMNWIIKEYKIIFDLTFKHPILTIILCLIAFIASFFLAPYMGNEFSPDYDKNRIAVNVTMPQGSKIETSNEVVAQVENILKNTPEVTSVISTIGENGVENGSVTAILKNLDDRDRGDLEIIDELIPKLARIPDVEFEVTRAKNMGGNNADVTINVFGDNYEQLIQNSEIMANIMEKTGYFQAILSSYKNPKDELRFIPDQKILTEYNVPNAYIATILRASIYGDDSNIFKEKGEEYKINVELDESYMTGEKDVKNINVLTRKGLFPITTFGKFEKAKAMPMLRRRDKNRVIVLSGYLVKSSSGQVSRELKEKFKAVKFERGEGFYFSGNAEMQDESEGELGKAFMLASILTFMILAAILNSSVFPIAIVTTIFTSLSGVIVALFFLGYSINIASLLAIVMLVGLVVNNAIILLDYAIVRIHEGVDIQAALWIAARDKFRVILMTSLAIIFGAMPQLQAVMVAKASMGAVMIGGVGASIIFTFVMIPVVFWYLCRMRNYFLERKIIDGEENGIRTQGKEICSDQARDFNRGN